MSTITKSALKVLRQEMQAALDKAGIKDFDLEIGNMSFTDSEVNIKVKGKLKGAVSASDLLFELKVKKLGLNLKGPKGETLIGYNANRRVNPWEYKTVRGTHYVCSSEQAQLLFAAA